MILVAASDANFTHVTFAFIAEIALFVGYTKMITAYLPLNSLATILTTVIVCAITGFVLVCSHYTMAFMPALFDAGLTEILSFR